VPPSSTAAASSPRPARLRPPWPSRWWAGRSRAGLGDEAAAV